MTTPTGLPRMLTVEQAAEVATISRRHAYHLVALGEIPSVRLGGAIRIPTFRLLELLDSTQLRADGDEPAAA